MSNYDDIINIPYPFDGIVHKLTQSERAAQFLPFDALSGHDEAIIEASRETTAFKQLDDESLQDLNLRLNFLKAHLDKKPFIKITSFEPDTKKAGGRYIVTSGFVNNIDTTLGFIHLTQGISLALNSILKLEGEIFAKL